MDRNNYFDPKGLSLEEVLKRSMGKEENVIYDENCKYEDHPNSSRYSNSGYVGYIEINISNPSSPKGHDSVDVPYDENGNFGTGIWHSK